MTRVAIATTPQPPYYVAVITVARSENDDGYVEMADAMYQLGMTQPGFLGMEWSTTPHSARGLPRSTGRPRRPSLAGSSTLIILPRNASRMGAATEAGSLIARLLPMLTSDGVAGGLS